MDLAEHVREQMKVEGHNADTLHAKGHMTHWGIVPHTPCTGVCNITDAEWLIEDIIYGGTDLAWEEHILTCPNEDHDECWCGEFTGTVLIGFKEVSTLNDAWFVVPDGPGFGKRGYVPDPDAEYSAIVGEIYAQIVRSRYVQSCELCSPCYPGQGNLEQGGTGDYIAYTLPPDVWGDRCPENVREWEG